MQNRSFYFFAGIVQVLAKGRDSERMLNDCLRHGMMVLDVKRLDNGTISFFIRLKDVHAFRKAVRKHECKCTFHQRKGLPFLLKKSRKNLGFVAGAVSFVFITFLLSNMIWGIEIKGADPKTKHLIQKELDKIGIRIGTLQFLTPSYETVRNRILSEVEGIAWIGVKTEGTTFHLEVAEKKQEEKTKQSGPQHLVAAKKAVIAKMFVEKGQPLVDVHDFVKKGQILVSGIIGEGDSVRKVAAKGEIFGETWYISTVEVPLTSTFQLFTGRSKTKHFLDFLDISIPVWGFWGNEEKGYKQYVIEESRHPLKILQWELPVFYKRETIRETEHYKRKYTINEARSKAIAAGKRDLAEKLGEDIEIKGEKVLHENVENGKVRLKIHFQVIENIVKTKRVQGD